MIGVLFGDFYTNDIDNYCTNASIIVINTNYRVINTNYYKYIANSSTMRLIIINIILIIHIIQIVTIE